MVNQEVKKRKYGSVSLNKGDNMKSCNGVRSDTYA